MARKANQSKMKQAHAGSGLIEVNQKEGYVAIEGRNGEVLFIEFGSQAR